MNSNKKDITISLEKELLDKAEVISHHFANMYKRPYPVERLLEDLLTDTLKNITESKSASKDFPNISKEKFKS